MSSENNSPALLLARALDAARVLAGEHDQQLGITAKGLADLLQQRLVHYGQAEQDLSASFPSYNAHVQSVLDPSVEEATGLAALGIIELLHHILLLQAFQEKSQPESSSPLGARDLTLLRTIFSLVSRWLLLPRIAAFDAAYTLIAPSSSEGQHATQRSGEIKGPRFEALPQENSSIPQERLQKFGLAAKSLSEIVFRLLSLFSIRETASAAAGSSKQAPKAQTFATPTDISVIFLRLHTPETLGGVIRLAFAPHLADDEVKRRALGALTGLLKTLSAQSALSALGSLSRSNPASRADNGGPPMPAFVRTMSSRLLSAQLLRPDGVRALLFVTLGGPDSDEADDAADQSQTSMVSKFEHIARLLNTPPKAMPLEIYLRIVSPRILDIILPEDGGTESGSGSISAAPPLHRRAGAFVLTRMTEQHTTYARLLLYPRLHGAFEPTASVPTSQKSALSTNEDPIVVTPAKLDATLDLVHELLSLAEPSPTFVHFLLGPILSQLFTLSQHLSTRTIVDAGVTHQKSIVCTIIRAWLKLVDRDEGAEALFGVVQRAGRGIGAERSNEAANDGRAVYWSEEQGAVCIRFGRPPAPDLAEAMSALATSSPIHTLTGKETEPHLPPELSAALQLQPDPRHFVGLISEARRKDIAGTLLVRLLDSYVATQNRTQAGIGSEGAETRSLVYLQIILQMVETFDASLLQSDPVKILSFVDFSLSTPAQRAQRNGAQAHPENANENIKDDDRIPFISANGAPGPREGALGALANVGAAESQGDAPASDADVAGDETAGEEADEEIVITALTLTLALLEGHQDLSMDNVSLLKVIGAKLDRHTESSNEEIRALSKEAKLVLIARQSTRDIQIQSSSALSQDTAAGPHSAAEQARRQSRETYQEALTLLQDPILPVRAHGLVLLRELVTTSKLPSVDPALLPAILDIFIQAVQDEESYLYLNAVKGLSEMGASGGKHMLASLVGTYLGRHQNLAGGGLTQREVDKRLRVGEAILQVVQRSGDALASHISTLVSPLLTALRDAHLSTALRTSIISILGTCVETAPLALASSGHAAEMAGACLDLLQLEFVRRTAPVRRRPAKSKSTTSSLAASEDDDDSDEEDDRPAQAQADSATASDPKLPQLRRAALLLLALLLRGAKHQLRDGLEGAIDAQERRAQEGLRALRMPDGSVLGGPGDGATVGGSALAPTPISPAQRQLLFPSHLLTRTKQVVEYVAQFDMDALVRHQAGECALECEELQLAMIGVGP